MHGDDVCRALVADRSGSRVLMLTASSTIKDRVDGLGLGADDYLPKPFDFAELIARVRALGRRASPASPPLLTHGDLTLDPARRVAVRAGRRMILASKELAVLEYLLAADGRVVSAEELLVNVWDEAVNPFTTAVKTTIGPTTSSSSSATRSMTCSHVSRDRSTHNDGSSPTHHTSCGRHSRSSGRCSRWRSRTPTRRRQPPSDLRGAAGLRRGPGAPTRGAPHPGQQRGRFRAPRTARPLHPDQPCTPHPSSHDRAPLAPRRDHARAGPHLR
jgi:hypothetical protein